MMDELPGAGLNRHLLPPSPTRGDSADNTRSTETPGSRTGLTPSRLRPFTTAPQPATVRLPRRRPRELTRRRHRGRRWQKQANRAAYGCEGRSRQVTGPARSV